MNFILENSIYFAILCFMLTSLADSFCDALYFSQAIKKYNNLWHWVKHGLNRPSLLLAGIFSFQILEKQIKNDFWHYEKDFLVLLFFFIVSFFIWQINYRYWKKFFDRKCYDQFL